MAFAVVCKSCQARFLLNDDLLRRRVAGKVVTVRCRQCHAAIEVDASDVDPKSLPPSRPESPYIPPPLKDATPKRAPSPPRPPKQSTLMGIGTPARTVSGSDMVALSPGFLNVAGAGAVPAAASTKATLHGFPEPPPPPPAAVEELNSGDWEIPDSKPDAQEAATRAVAVTSAPESLDDFVEELPPSLPPPEEDPLPSSSGTPSLKALAHHEEHAAKPKIDDFFANMSAAMNGGVMPEASGAPTIDISSLTAPAPAPAETETEIDITALDVPLTGTGKTLPLFALGNDQAALLTAPAAAEPTAPQKKAASSPAAGSLSPASLDQPTPSSRRTESSRERKNVVAPATKSVPPAAPQKRSGLAAPVLLGLAAVAGFLIWKRSAPAPSVAAEQAPKVVAAAEPAPQPETVTPAVAAAPTTEAAPPTALAGVTATPTAAEVGPETTPAKPAATTVHDKSAASTPATTPDSTTPSNTKPAEPARPAATTAPQEAPAPAVTKEEPAAEPAPPAEPAGPFDRAAAQAALSSAAAQASACRKEGDPSGVASVVITFAPSGRVTSANVSGPPFAGTPTGGCIASALRRAKVPPFDGDRVTVSKTITIQ
ncbi:MAG TPA: hypothetical protein VHB79_34405 [Polyangiaceae bacterium]|nr:hypothetical protein [Polyangiaceae bacterium]